MIPITPAELAAYIDHAQVRAYAQRKEFEKRFA